jgi:hypothetical protein
MAERTTVTMGWDVGDEFTDVCVLAPDAAILEQQRVRTTTHSLEKQLSRYPGALVVLEVGVHSRWISDLVRSNPVGSPATHRRPPVPRPAGWSS